MDFNFIDNFRKVAVEQYQVDPYIFIFLMIVTTPFWYHSWFLVIKEMRAIYKDKKENKSSAKVIFDNKKLFNAITYNFIVWVIPYAYVIIFGRGLPINFWIFFIFGLSITLAFQVRRILSVLRK